MNKSNLSHRVINRGAAVVAVSVLLLGGCASATNSYSNADHSVDFNQFQTYAFAQDMATDEHDYQSLESTHLKQLVSQQMEQRGYRQSAQPDIVIHFAIDTEEKIRTRTVPAMGLHAGYYDPIYDYGWGMASETRIDQYTEGRLKIAAVDASTNKVAWEGTTQGRLTRKAEKNMQATLASAVVEVFQHFPGSNPNNH